MTSAVTIRPANGCDSDAIVRIAERDTKPVPPAPYLVAERDGEPLVVLSLRSGEVVADPFAPTAELVDLVRLAGKAA